MALCEYQHQSPLARLQPSRRSTHRSCCFQENSSPGPCWDALWSVSHMREQQSPVPTLPVSPGPHGTNLVLQLRHPKKPLPSLDLPGPKADSFPPEGCLQCFPGKGAHKCHQPLPRPQQLQLPQPGLAGDGECSWHRSSTPELAFGYQPWVWFEILPENVTTSSGRALLPQTLEKVTSHQPFSVQCTPSRRSTSSSSLTPQQARLAPHSP